MAHRSLKLPTYAKGKPAAAAALLVTLVLATAGCHGSQDSGGGTPTPVASDPAISAPAASSTPSSSPSPSATSATPDPDTAAAKAAVGAYKHYMTVTISNAKKAPSPHPSKALLSLTTGLESNYVRNDAAASYKRQTRIISGHVPVTTGPVTLSNHAAKAVFETCLDYRTIRTEEHGKPIKTLRWVRNRVQMRLISDRWLVSEQDGWKGKVGDSCPQDIS